MSDAEPNLKRKRKPLPPHWYEFTSTECVLCGAGADMERRRRYTPKPAKPEDRYHYHQYACQDHFL